MNYDNPGSCAFDATSRGLERCTVTVHQVFTANLREQFPAIVRLKYDRGKRKGVRVTGHREPFPRGTVSEQQFRTAVIVSVSLHAI